MTNVRGHPMATAGLLVMDALAVTGAYCFAYWARFTFLPTPKGVPAFSHYAQAIPIVCVVALLMLRQAGLYQPPHTRRLTWSGTWMLVKAVTVSLAVLLAVTFFYRSFSFSRAMFFVYWASTSAFLAGLRWSYLSAVQQLTQRIQAPTRLVFVGWGPMAQPLLNTIRERGAWNYDFLGCVPVPGETLPQGVTALRSLDQFPQLLADHHVEEIILTRPDLKREDILSLILECEKAMVSFQLVADLLSMVTTQVDIQAIEGIPLLSLKESPLTRPANRLIKRAMDVALSAIGLLVAAPLMALIVILIKLNSKGPVLYRQERVGEDGKPFLMYKFRTMRVDAERETGPVWASPDDARRTRAGQWLRQYNLDELPQLANVLKGEMSLVGPRPERPHFVNQFKDAVPRYMARHRIRSGLTGWAQVHGLRGDTSIEERTKYDLYYLENWSPLLDLKILLRSFTATKNAY